jgi:hypothetical protein
METPLNHSFIIIIRYNYLGIVVGHMETGP